MKYNIPRILYFSLFGFVLSIAWHFVTDFSQDFDLWMHLFFGKEIFMSGSIPKVDHWSFTAEGLPIFNHEWLAQVIFYLFYNFLGDAGLIFLRFILFFGICFCLWKVIILRVDNLFARIIAMLLVILVLRSGIAFRIQLFSYFFLSLIIFLEISQSGFKKWKLFFYPLLFLIWANLHGAFVLGLLVLGLFSFTLAIPAFLVTFINPYGFDLWFYIFHELSLSKSSLYITEWQPFSFQAREMAFFLMFIITALLLIVGIKKQKLSFILLFLIAAYLGFSAVRHTPLMAILGLPAFITGLQSVFLAEVRKDNFLSKTLAAYLVCLSCSILYFNSVSFKINTKSEALPEKAVEFLEQHHATGNLMLPLHWGGYALFRLAPQIKVSIDGRWATLYPEKVMEASHVFDYAGDRGVWKKIADNFDADILLLERGNTIIAEILEEKGAWHLVYRDEISCIFKLL